MKKSMKMVWKELSKLAKGQETVIVAVKKLIAITGLAESTIRQATKELAEANVIGKEFRHSPDHRTGRDRQRSNQYQILIPFSGSKSGGGDGSEIGGLKNYSLKDFKEFKIIKKEEDAPAPSTPSSVITQDQIKTEPIKQNPIKSQQKQPATREEVLEVISPVADQYHPAVIKQVIDRFLYRMRKGWIYLPMAWLNKALATAQDLFDRTGQIELSKPKRNTYTTAKTARPKVELVTDQTVFESARKLETEEDTIDLNAIQKARELAKLYEKEKDRAVAV